MTHIRVFFLHRAQEAILDKDECVFLQIKTPVMSDNPGKKLNLGEQIFFGAQGGQFVTFEHLPNIDKPCDQDIRRGLPNIWIFVLLGGWTLKKHPRFSFWLTKNDFGTINIDQNHWLSLSKIYDDHGSKWIILKKNKRASLAPQSENKSPCDRCSGKSREQLLGKSSPGCNH